MFDFPDAGWVGGIVAVCLIGGSLLLGSGSPLRRSEANIHVTAKQPSAETVPATSLVKAVQATSKFLSLRAFPLGLFVKSDMDPSIRDGLVDRYVIAWIITFLVIGVATFGLQKAHPLAGTWVATFFAWLAAYRTIDIVASRIYILITFAGVAPFGLNRARRSIILSIIDVGQVVMAYAFMFQGWVSDQWKVHQLLGFAYISMRVLFTLGPPEEPSGAGAKALIGTEIIAGLVVIALGVAGYLSALREHQSTSDSVSGKPIGKYPDDAPAVYKDSAWKAFAQSLSGAFHVSNLALVEGKRGEDSWFFSAEAAGNRFEGTVGFDGRWVHIKKIT